MVNEKPIIIGVGGLLERGERGKVTDLLDILSKQYGCATYEVGFSSITRNGDNIICAVSEKGQENVHEAITHALNDERNNPSRIGIITSSMGAVPVSELIASNNLLCSGLRAYAAIAPFTKIHPLARKYIETLLTKEEDLEFGSPIDKERGIRRILPAKNIPYILGIDLADTVKAIPSEYNFKTLTLFARSDERVDINTTAAYHAALRGNAESLIGFETKHAIPYEIVRKPIIDFITSVLDLTAAEQSTAS